MTTENHNLIGLTMPIDWDGRPWHSDTKPLAWRWSLDLDDPETAQMVLDNIQERGALVEVWVWSDSGQDRHGSWITYARVEGARNAAMPLYFHQFYNGVHTYNRCIGPL